ncbi:hypothetical protein [Nannocystis bainbridge]|uniref:UBA domain-containing protein n=1 Tax=Nannocystis bainbridge TaxID=2995303 RepID=A0ABT5E481_9BACT|nr:hypothetical protein [Nannocystis bainbridge]MDC0720670.1 hypothetical protein [Nannocystis bainbridge]
MSAPIDIPAIAAQLQAQGYNDAARILLAGGEGARAICALLGNGASPTPSLSNALAAGGNTASMQQQQPAAPAGGCGCGPRGGGGGCGGGACGLKGPCVTTDSYVCATPPATQPSTAPVPGAPSAVPVVVPPSVGSWNCETVRPDLAPCEVGRIRREDKLITVSEATLAGPLAAGDTIGTIIAEVGISHNLCVDSLAVEIETNGVRVPVTIGQVMLQGERIAQDPQGPYVHVWEWSEPERPDYVGITDSRCACKELCVCVPAEGRARLTFDLPSAVAGGSTLVVTVWGRRTCWLTSCGPCPPCQICGQATITPAEDALAPNTLYAVA